MRKNHLSWSIIFLIIMTDVGESVAQTFMKTGLNTVGMDNITFSNLGQFVLKSAGSVHIWLGMAVFLINFLLWITILSRIDLSVAHPVGSFSYILVPILAMTFLHETISPMRWVGIVLIVSGIHFIVQSTKTETMPL